MSKLIRRACAKFSAAALMLVATSAFALDSTTGQTTDIQFNSPAAADLKAAATALYSPAAMYEYVRNNYEFALYHGARSGSVNAFLGGRGNDVDLAATLIAMLRSQSIPIPARYVVGTVRLPAARAMNWLGVKNIDLAYGILRDQGIQGVVLSGDKSTIDFEHVWVEALVPYAHYRGAGFQTVNCVTTPAECNWVSIDPSFKLHASRTSGLDPHQSLTFDYTSYYNAIANNDAARRDKNPLEIYQDQVLAWLRTNAPGKSLEDIPDLTDIVAENNGLLPASLPYGLVNTPRRYNSVADHDAVVPSIEPKKWGKILTVKIRTTAGGSPFEYTLNAGGLLLTDISINPLTLSMVMVGSVPNLVLKAGSTEVARPLTGSTISGYTPHTGDVFNLDLSLDGAPSPSGGTDQIIAATYSGVIGGYYLLATGGESSNWSQVHRAAKALLAANVTYKIVFKPGESGCLAGGINCTPYVDTTGNGWDASDPRLLDNKTALDALTGGLLNVAATQYYAKLREQIAQLDAINKVKTPISGFLGVVSNTYEVEYVDGTAFSVLPGGLLIDMKGLAFSGSWRIDQAATPSNAEFELLGHISSSLEHEIWQELTGYDAISTVRGIQMALATGATLLNPKKNASVDTVPPMYASFGYGTVAPSTFAIAERTIYTTRPATWSHPTTDFTQAFALVKRLVTDSNDTRRSALNYQNSFHHGNVSCFFQVANDLQSLYDQYGGSATFTNAGSLCLSSYPAGTTIQQAINLNQSDWTTYQTSYIGQTFFDYLDENKGFSPSLMAFRTTTALATNAQLQSMVTSIRDNLYLRNVNDNWGEYLIPSILSTGPTFRFSVAIRKDYNTASGKLVNAEFQIQNASVSAGGGYVSGDAPLTPSLAVPGSTTVTPTFNNATFTNLNTISESNNNLVKTASTADPVSTATGNNYHDETDFTIKGRGVHYAFTRTYNSAPSSTSINGPLGYGWTHSYGMRLKSNDYGSCPNCAPGSGAGQRPENGNSKTSSISYTDERGGEHSYLVNETTFAITTPQGEFDALAVDTPVAGQATLIFRNGVKYIFESATNIKSIPNVTARLKQIADPWGNQLNFAYDGSGRLSTVTDNLGISGRTGLTFVYDAASKLQRITDWTGRQWNYVVNASGDLTSYTNPLSQQARYTYVTGKHQLQDTIKPLQRSGQDVKTTFKYYQNGRAFSYANAYDETETLDYDLYRKTTRVTDPREGTREYQYDDSGRLTKLLEPDGAILLFSNTNTDGLRYQKTDGVGYTTQYSYRADRTFNTASDNGGNVTREQDPMTNTVDMTYGPYDQIATVKDKRGTVRTTVYHATTDATCKAANKPDTVTLSSLSGVSNVRLQDFCWYSDGALKSTTDYIVPGNTTRKRQRTVNYSDSAHLTVQSLTETGTDGTTVTRSFTYDALGRMKTETLQRRKSPTDASLINLTSSYTYDALDRVTLVEDAVGNQLDTVYDANGKVYQVIGHYKQPDNSYVLRTLSTRFYDATDLLAANVDVNNVTTNYFYDSASNLAGVMDAYQHITRYEYDAMNRRTAVIDANGNRTTTVYDLAGQIKQIIDGNGNATTNNYDALGRLTSVVDPMGFTSTYGYDANGNMTCRVDANAQAGLQPKNSNNCTEYRLYDELNRVVQIKDALNGTTIKAYDLFGNVTSITDASTKTTGFAYDDLGRQTQSTDPLGKVTSFVRDEAGNAYQITNRLAQVTRVTFDNLNRPTRYDYLTDGTNETMTYDSFGNKDTVSNVNVSYTFTYDKKNRLLSKTDSRSNKKLLFGYDAVDNLITKTDYQNQTTDFQYDSANRLVSMRNPAYLKAIYQYDPAGRLLSRVLSDGAKSAYTWDASGRLRTLLMTAANGSTVTNLAYTPDRVGNIVNESGTYAPGQTDTRVYTYDALYRLTNVSSTAGAGESFTYDAVGNRQIHNDGAAHAYEFFPNSNRLKAVHAGTLVGAIEKSFTYDDEGRLLTQSGGAVAGYASSISWDQKNRASTMTSSLGAATTFKYDPMDYRIGRTGGTLGARDYYLEGEHLEAEYANGTLQSKYFRGITTDELVANFTLTNNVLKPSIYHHNQLMSVTGLSAHDGTSQQNVVYGAFGNVRSLTGSPTNRQRYTGREIDNDTQLYNYRARYYDPSTGRFISEDPLGFNAGINFYTYVGNNPINFNDPSGLIDYGKATQALIDMANGGAGVFTGGVQIVGGAGLIATPEPTMLTKVGGVSLVALGATNVANSSVSLVNGTRNLVSALRDEPTNLPSSGLALAASTFFPGNATASNLATVADLSLAFVSGRVPAGNVSRYAGSAFAQSTAGTLNEVLDARSLAPPGGLSNLFFSVGPAKESFASAMLDIFQLSSAGSVLFNQIQSFDSSSSAAGGYLLYPNKPNSNSLQVIYSK